MMTFLLGYVAGGLSLGLLLAGVNAYLTARRAARAARAPRAPAAPPDDLTLLRRGLAEKQRWRTRMLGCGNLTQAEWAEREIAELRQKIAALEARRVATPAELTESPPNT
jgi:hypothetical protein